MNKRGFIQTLAGALAACFAPMAWTKPAVVINDNWSEWVSNEKTTNPIFGEVIPGKTYGGHLIDLRPHDGPIDEQRVLAALIQWAETTLESIGRLDMLPFVQFELNKCLGSGGSVDCLDFRFISLWKVTIT